MEIIKTEGPVVLKRVFRLYARAAGIKKVGGQLRGIFLRASEIALSSEQIEEERGQEKLGLDCMVRSAESPPVVVRKRGPRSFEEIPPSEISEVMRSIVKTHPSIGKEILYRRVLEFYDLKRLTSKVRKTLDRIVTDEEFKLTVTNTLGEENSPGKPKSYTGSKYLFELLGDNFSTSTQVGILVTVLREIHEIDQEFLSHLSQEKSRTRPIIARSPNDLYPGNPGLSHLYLEVANGWFVGTNHAGRDVYRMLKVVCKIAGLDFGKDLCGPAIEEMKAKFS